MHFCGSLRRPLSTPSRSTDSGASVTRAWSSASHPRARSPASPSRARSWRKSRDECGACRYAHQQHPALHYCHDNKLHPQMENAGLEETADMPDGYDAATRELVRAKETSRIPRGTVRDVRSTWEDRANNPE